MMSLENQLCTLEQAKKFDELGVKAESYFVWITGVDGQLKPFISVKDHACWKPETLKHSYPAYSCSELGVMLPDSIRKNGKVSYLQTHKDEDSFLCIYPEIKGLHAQSEHEAHSKSDLALELVEKGIIKPEGLKL